jgi:hypothetical protein
MKNAPTRLWRNTTKKKLTRRARKKSADKDEFEKPLLQAINETDEEKNMKNSDGSEKED